jgi:hypothetical protein
MSQFTFFMSDFGVDISHLCCLCDSDFISPDYERLVLEMDNTSRAFVCVVEDNVEAIAVVQYDTRHDVFEEDIEHVVIMDLLCKTTGSDVIGAAKLLLEYINIMLYQDGKRIMYIKIADEYNNHRAVNFYRKMGFVKHPPNDFGQVYWSANIRAPLDL